MSVTVHGNAFLVRMIQIRPPRWAPQNAPNHFFKYVFEAGWSPIGAPELCTLMFPTIYGIALEGLGEDTKLGAAGLVMAILGGAIMPLFQAAIIDSAGVVVSYIVPDICFLLVGGYGYFDMRAKKSSAKPQSDIDADALKKMEMGILYLT